MIKNVNKIFNSDIKKPKISRNLLTFSVFLIISSFLWFLNMLDNEHVTEVGFDINLVNIPSGYIIIEQQNKKIVITISATGFDIINKFNKNENINIDIKKYSKKYYTSRDSIKYYILTKYINEQIPTETKSKIKIINISTDTLFFTMAKTEFKYVKIKPVTDLTFVSGYMQTDNFKAFPDSIKVFGVKKYLNKIEFISTQKLTLKNVKDTITTTLNLKKNKNFIYSPEKVKIIIPVDRYTEKSLSIPLKIINLPDSLDIITFPSEIKLNFNVGINNYNSINESDFEAIATFTHLKKELPENLKVELVKFPTTINSVKIQPEYVEYILKKH